MPSYTDLWPPKWLKADHLQGKRPTVTVEAVTVEKLWNPRTRRNEPRLIIQFYKKTLRMILNKTQAQVLASATGQDDYQLWIGCQIVLSQGTAPNGMPTIVASPIPDPPPETPTINGTDGSDEQEPDHSAITANPDHKSPEDPIDIPF